MSAVLRDDDVSADPFYGRRCKIELVADTYPGARSVLELSECAGCIGPRQYGRRREIKLHAGRSINVELQTAMMWFGPFLIPGDIADMVDERKRRDLMDYFRTERARKLLHFGGYPMPRREHDGNEPTGVHRFPHVIVTVTDADGVEHDPIDLHELYRIGEWDDNFALRPSSIEAPLREEDARDDKVRSLELQIAEVRGYAQGRSARPRRGAAPEIDDSADGETHE